MINYILRGFWFTSFILFLTVYRSLIPQRNVYICFGKNIQFFIIKPEIDDKMLLVIITMKTIKGSKNETKKKSSYHLIICQNVTTGIEEANI